jgi:hypothetical protein
MMMMMMLTTYVLRRATWSRIQRCEAWKARYRQRIRPQGTPRHASEFPETPSLLAVPGLPALQAVDRRVRASLHRGQSQCRQPVRRTATHCVRHAQTMRCRPEAPVTAIGLGTILIWQSGYGPDADGASSHVLRHSYTRMMRHDTSLSSRLYVVSGNNMAHAMLAAR